MARPPNRGPRTVSLPLARDGGPGADADSGGCGRREAHTPPPPERDGPPTGRLRDGRAVHVRRRSRPQPPRGRARIRARVPPGGRALRAARTRRVLARPLVPRAAEAQHEEEDPEPGEQAEEEGVRAVDAYRQEADPHVEAEGKPPEERREAAAEGGGRAGASGASLLAPAGRARPEPHGFVQ